MKEQYIKEDGHLIRTKIRSTIQGLENALERMGVNVRLILRVQRVLFVHNYIEGNIVSQMRDQWYLGLRELINLEKNLIYMI